MFRILPFILLSAAMLFADDAAFVPPLVHGNQQNNPQVAVNVPALAAPAAVAVADVRSKDSILGDRIARITADMEKIPQDQGQIWREYDITPYTKDRKFAADVKPEQTLIDWILRQTGVNTWHTAPFGILTADSEKLYVYHTKDIQLIVADIVDRFVSQQFAVDACSIRFISLAKPDWIAKGHQYLKPVPIATPGVQGWILEKEGAQLLLQELGRRSDFKEVMPPQLMIPNGSFHSVVSKRPRNYLRDVQANTSALNGYAEDRVSLDEGFSLSFVPLALLDAQNVAAAVKLDVIQVEKMLSTMLDVPTTQNPRQRIQIETPQIAHFKLDEMIRFPKSKILLLDLGTIPLPNLTEDVSKNVLAEIAKGIGPSKRGNMLLFIESTTGLATIPTMTSSAAPTAQPSALTPSRTALGNGSSYWQGIR
jgi:hypothetical protein